MIIVVSEIFIMEDCLNVVFEEMIIDEIFMSMEFLKEVDMK